MLRRQMPWYSRPPANLQAAAFWDVFVDNGNKAFATLYGQRVARGAMSASHGITAVGPAILAGNRSGSTITMGQVSVPSFKPSNGFTFVALIAMSAPAQASNESPFLVAGESGTDYRISFAEAATYNRVAIAMRNNYTTVLNLSYDFAAAMPFGLLQADFDGNAARILWNGHAMASGVKSGAIPASVSPAAASANHSAGYQTSPAVAFVAYKDSFDGRVFANPWQVFAP